MDVFFKSLMVQPFLLCGRRLKPFSLIHLYALQQLENPYVKSGKEKSAQSLLEAINICSKTFAEIPSALTDTPTLREWLWYRKWLRRDLSIASDSFDVYLDDYVSVPKHVDWGKSSSPMSAPWQFHCVRNLMDVYHFTESQAWDCPVGKARCYHDTWSESEGDDTLVSAVQEDVDRFVVFGNKMMEEGNTEEAQKAYHMARQIIAQRDKTA